jgi:FkbM family methyltransferase
MDIVLFGTSIVGRHALAGLRKAGVEPVCFAIDNPTSMHVDGLIVLSVEDAVREYPHALFVSCLFNPSMTINRLHRLGVRAVSFAELTHHYSTLLPFMVMDNNETIWADVKSKMEYRYQMQFRLDGRNIIHHLPIEDIYFPADLFDLRRNEVFVDCGAYTGDTINSFRAHGGDGEIIAIEPDRNNFKQLIWRHPDITPYQCALGSTVGMVSFNGGQGVSSSISSALNADTTICNTLDNILLYKAPTIIKMDIEGAELDALKGAENTIKQHKPILAICLYHKPADLWEIPLYIRSIVPDYRLYLRRYAEDCWETILYCIPPERVRE